MADFDPSVANFGATLGKVIAEAWSDLFGAPRPLSSVDVGRVIKAALRSPTPDAEEILRRLTVELAVLANEGPAVANPTWNITDGDIEPALQAIERWHMQHHRPCPPDAEFEGATAYVPAGTTLDPHPDMVTAERLRIVFPNGNRYLLDLEVDCDLRGDSWHCTTTCVLTDAEVVK